MQEKETTKDFSISDVSEVPASGRLLSLDLGTRKVGVAVSDELQFTVRHVGTITRNSWKNLLKEISRFLNEFDAQALVIGLPLSFDGTESEMSAEARRLARNFSLSIDVPVFLHDERVTTYEARGRLWELGLTEKDIRRKIDAEAASIILNDFIQHRNDLLKRTTG